MIVAPAQKMRVLSWNLLHGQKIPPTNSQNWQEELSTAAKAVANRMHPDFLALQEVDNFQPRSGGINQIKLIAESMKFRYWAYLPTLIGTPGEKWRKVKDLHQATMTEENYQNDQIDNVASYGIALATNIPIKKLHSLKLGRSLIGTPLMFPKDNGKGVRFIYVKDEPRMALVAELENGFTIATTHLSFVPGVNIFQLNKLSALLTELAGVSVIAGDLNLPANLPSKTSGFRSVLSQSTYPSWNPKVQFDYIMARKSLLKKVGITFQEIKSINPGISDHIPIGVTLQI
jgi:endonuclease/exonuclease/phosphatase family metal-dependent hydrolase